MRRHAALGDNAVVENWNAIDQYGVVFNAADFIDAPLDNNAITYGAGGLRLTANRPGAIITAINGTGTLRVSQNLSIGSIIGGGLPITIDIGKTLTLTGTPAALANHGFKAVANTYTGLGNVTLEGADSILVVQANNTISTVTATLDGEGILIFAGAGGVTGTIGGVGQALAEVNFGIAAGPNAGGGVVNLKDAATAADFNINHNNVIVIARGLMTSTGTVNFNAAGRLTAHFGITGNVDFHGNNGTIILGSGKTITGAVNNTGGGAAGVLNFAGAGNGN